MSAPPSQERGRVPQLDGLRAIAVLWVIGLHAEMAIGRAGMYGVDLFFVLSGFLITGVLLGEWEKHGRISLRRFYARRLLRLYPALIVMILLLSVDGPFFSTDKTWASWWHAAAAAASYTANLFVIQSDQFNLGVLGPTWSLAVEEQFYLLWPLLLIGLLHMRLPRAWLAAGCAVLGLAGMSMFWLLYASDGVRGAMHAYFRSDVRFAEILLGCALAITLAGSRTALSRRADRLLGAAAVMAIVGLTFARQYHWARFGHEGNLMGAVPLVAVCGVVLVARLATSDAALLSRVLRLQPLPWIGGISYGLYLWHGAVFEVVMPEPSGLQSGLRLPAALALTVLAAWLSHAVVERPFLRLKDRLRSTPVAGLQPAEESAVAAPAPAALPTTAPA